MKLLIADDDPFFRELLQRLLAPHHELVLAADGNEAWEKLQDPNAPRLAILDWVMPGLSGPQVCRKVRTCSNNLASSAYLIILTAKNSEADIVSGLRAGADDYLTKPPVPAELKARVRVGERILALQDVVLKQTRLVDRVSEENSLTCQGLIRCPSMHRRVGEDIIEPCSQVHCAPDDCCSLSERNTARLTSRILNLPAEKYHFNR